MLHEKQVEFTKADIDEYLKAVAKEYRRLGGRAMPAEIILIGGAAVMINYGFRNMTTDIDALIQAASIIKDAINSVGDRYNLPACWLNSDFLHTESYSDRLIQYSKYCKTYSNVLHVRTVSAEYLIAMKLKSGRMYKNDLSDILGILAEHKRNNDPIGLEQIHKAVDDLYGGWTNLPESSALFIENVMNNDNYEKLYPQIRDDEQYTREKLVSFDRDHQGELNGSNVNSIAADIQEKSNRNAILSLLKNKQNK